ncbi:MAG: phosphatidate cytidylyltransferase, partial [Bacteroidales bacterium]|nr:phosphatidate cytidylyltransferase [Bacteroidales bacterium]
MNTTVKRTISGAIFVLVMVLCMLWNQFSFAALMVFIMSCMIYEFCQITIGKSHMLSQWMTIFAGAVFFILIFFHAGYGLHVKYVALAIVPVFFLMIHSLYVKDKTDYGKYSNMYTALLYVGVPMSLSNLIIFTHQEYNGLLMLCFFIIIWATDVGGYCFGLTFGKNGKKLFPSISPKKSWAGFWGGMFLAVFAAYVLTKTGLLLAPDMTTGIPSKTLPLYHCVGLAVSMHIAG